MHACSMNQKQFGCSKFLSVNANDTQVCKGETSKKTTIHAQLKTSRQLNDIRDTGPDTENTDHGPDMVFLRTACQPIRIENFEKPYNKKKYRRLKTIVQNLLRFVIVSRFPVSNLSQQKADCSSI